MTMTQIDFDYEFKRVNHDMNGNSRHVVHFLALLSPLEKATTGVLEGYALAVKKSHKIGGRKYTGKDFGGGIVFTYGGDLNQLAKDIQTLALMEEK